MTSGNERLPQTVSVIQVLPAIIWESAIESAINTFLMLLMGGIALGIVGGIVHDMIPTLPPELAARPRPESNGSFAFHGGWTWLQQHRFALLFCFLFILTCRARLNELGGARELGKFEAWAQHVKNRLSEEWFGLIVGNAFSAMVAAFVLAWVQNFSWTHWLLAGLFNWVAGSAQAVLAWVCGASLAGQIGNWLSWYEANQFKFGFWLIYVAAISDDLGLPNLKTVARYCWRRLKGTPALAKTSSTEVEVGQEKTN